MSLGGEDETSHLRFSIHLPVVLMGHGLGNQFCNTAEVGSGEERIQQRTHLKARS